MKRALVTYPTDSDSENEAEVPPPSKRRKQLPKLSKSITPLILDDDPSKHQGRIRSQPFVDGQFATHIYVPVYHEALLDLLDSVMDDVQQICEGLDVFSFLKGHAQTGEGEEDAKRELHLSVSRPLYVRSHQREMVKRTVKDLARRRSTFETSFASFTILDNDEKTRSFLAIEVGAGHAELSTMSTSLNPLLDELRQPAYYNEPRYHVSIAWILTTKPEAPRFPDDLVESLESRYGARLRAHVTQVEELCTRIGKQVTRFKLV